MILSLLYQLALVGIYVGASLDFMRLSASRPLLSRRVASCALVASGAQVVFIALLALTGNFQRTSAQALFYLSNSLYFLVLLPVGAHWSLFSGSPIFPFLRRLWPDQMRVDPLFPSPKSSALRTRRPLLLFLALLGVGVGFTVLLATLVTWKVNPAFEKALETQRHSGASNLFLGLYLLLSAAVVEEVLFRHYLLNRLIALWPAGKRRRDMVSVAAVALVALFFAFGHGSMLSPAWMKYAQIFVLGLCLGVCELKLGIEACIGLHAAFNLSMVAVGSLT